MTWALNSNISQIMYSNYYFEIEYGDTGGRPLPHDIYKVVIEALLA